jgi:syntaxin 7
MQCIKTKPVKSSERAQFDKLTKEFEQLLSQYTELTQAFINKEKEILRLSQNEPQAYEPQQEQKRDSYEFKYAGGIEDLRLSQREDEVRALEQDMQEINRMFVDVAKMVDEQGEQLDVVEGEVDSAVKETGKAVMEITKAEGYQRAARKKMICIIVIIVVIVCVVIAVVVGLFH